MFDPPYEAVAVMIAIAAFLIAMKATNQATELRRRLNAMEAVLQGLRPIQPPPLPPQPMVQTSSASSASDQPQSATAEPELAPAILQDAARPPTAPSAAPIPPPP